MKENKKEKRDKKRQKKTRIRFKVSKLFSYSTSDPFPLFLTLQCIDYNNLKFSNRFWSYLIFFCIFHNTTNCEEIMGMFGSRIRRTRKTCLAPSFFFFSE